MTRPLPPILAAYSCIAAPVMADAFDLVNCCLNATRVTIEVMRLFGFKVRAQAVETIVMNEPYYRRLRNGGSHPKNEEEARDWIAEGAWSLQVDYRECPEDQANNAWPGHLVAIVEQGSRSFLVDASFAQMRRPAKNIFTPAVLVEELPLPEVWNWNGTYVFYRPVETRSFENQSGFARHEGNLRAAAEIAFRLRQHLEVEQVRHADCAKAA